MKLAVIVPVLDEAEELAAGLSRLRDEPNRQDIEIVVADGGSRDATLEVSRRLADRVLALGRRGRAFQMHQGALAAKGEVLLFLHADTRLPAGWYDVLEQAWEGAAPPAATAFGLRFDHEARFYRCIERTAALRNRLTGVPQGDQAIAVARRDYLAVGGFPDVPLMEEYYLIRRLKRLGEVRILPAAVLTSARRYERNGRLFHNLRNVLITGLFYLGAPPRALARLYR